MKVRVLTFLSMLLLPLSALANCYVIQNNSNFAQRVDVHYNGPVNSGPITIALPSHGRYPAQGSWCWNDTEGYTADIYIDPGAYTLHFNGNPWSAPVVFGNGPSVTPSGTFTLDPPRPRSSTKDRSPNYDPLYGYLRQFSAPPPIPSAPSPSPTGIHVRELCPHNSSIMVLDEEISPQGDGYIKQGDCTSGRGNNSEQDFAKWKTTSYSATWRCSNNGRIGGTLSFDSHLTGARQGWDCSTGNVTLEQHFTNYLIDGAFRNSWVSGQFKNGKPVGRWTFSGPGGTLTEQVPDNSTVYWAVPDVFDSFNDPNSGCFHMYFQAGQLVSGVKEGVWYSQICKNSKVLKVLEGGYVDDRPDGEWRWYSPTQYDYSGNLVAIETFKNGTASGPFMYSSGHLTVIGEIDDDGSEIIPGLQGTLQMPPFQGEVKLSGVWQYYTTTGILLGQSSLLDGDGQLTQFFDDGGIAAQGNVLAGLPSGLWKLYDWNHRLCLEVTYDHGVQQGTTHFPCPTPQLFGHPSGR